MIYIVHKDGRGFTATTCKRDAEAFSKAQGGIPKSHWFFYDPESNPFISTDHDGVYHYKGESMNLEASK